MPIPQVTILYAGLLGLVAIYLSATAGIRRGKTGISLGDGGDQELLLRMRRHANFVENTPLALVLIALLEMQGTSSTAIHWLAGALLLGRVMHIVGFGENVSNPVRGIGAGLSILVIAVASIWGITTFF